MKDHRKKWTKSDFNFVDNDHYEPYVETNILIKEEAEYLNHFRNDVLEEQHPELVSNLSVSMETIESSSQTKSILDESLNEFKQSLSESIPTKEVLESFENSMQTTISKLDQIADILKFGFNNNSQNESKSEASILAETLLEQQKLNQMKQSSHEDELIKSFQRLLDLRMEESNSQIRNMVDELDFTKQRFNELLVKYEKTLLSVSEKQVELNSYLFDSHSTINRLTNDVKISKDNYLKVEDEIAKIFVTWTENNKLLTKLESLIYEIGSTKLGYDEDLNLLLDQIKNKAVDNQNDINKLTSNLSDMREQLDVMNKNYEKLAQVHDENIDIIKNAVKNNELELNEIKSKHENEIEDLRLKLDDDILEVKSTYQSDLEFFKETYSSEFNALKEQYDNEIKGIKEKSFEHLEKITDIESKVKQNAQEIDEIKSRIEVLADIERNVDNVLSNEIFQKSLEMKITNMIIENNNYLGDEFRQKIELFSTNVISDIDDVRKNNDDLITNYQNLENKVLEIANNLNSMDKTAEIQSQLDFIEQNYQSLYDRTAERIKDNIKLIDNQLSGLKIDEKEIVDLINSSHELSTIIQDKTRQVIEEQLSNVKIDIEQIEKNLENNIKHYNDKLLANSFADKIAMETSRIKNETLNLIYKELITRDERIDLNSDELVRNYETILECNRVLSNLEQLVIKQSDEFDGYRLDETNAISILTDKITEQKAKISELEESIRANVSEFNFYGDNDSSKSLQRGLEAWRLEFSADMTQMVKNLVNEEIKRKNLISSFPIEKEEKVEQQEQFDPFNYKAPNFEENANKRSEDFFVNRVKDILKRLEDTQLKNVFDKKFNLNINLEDIKEEKVNVEVTKDNSSQDDDLNWFYEKQYNEFVSRKKKK